MSTVRRLIASHVNVDCTPCEVGVTINMVIGSIGIGKSLQFGGHHDVVFMKTWLAL